MALNKTAAAYLAYFAYIDQALEVPNPADFVQMLAQVPAGAANGPWMLTWEAGLMHSMALQYFPHATNSTAPPLPNTMVSAAMKPRAVPGRRPVRLGARE
jgi:hypothetical protein